MHTSTKHYPHTLGLSCVFRQHRAASHCAQLHGYALAFTFEIGCNDTDENGWAYDFGGLKPLKAWLEYNFDHTTLVAKDDPHIGMFYELEKAQMVNLRVVERVGCEAVAELAWGVANDLIMRSTDGRAFCTRCTVHEHEGNSATYHPAIAPYLKGN